MLNTILVVTSVTVELIFALSRRLLGHRQSDDLSIPPGYKAGLLLTFHSKEQAHTFDNRSVSILLRLVPFLGFIIETGIESHGQRPDVGILIRFIYLILFEILQNLI